MSKVQWLAVVVSFLASVSGMPARAQAYPNKPITVVIPLAAGSNLDVVMRPMAIEMQRTLGQPIVVENRPGANSTIGTKFVVGARPDGYTLLFQSVITAHPVLNRHNGIDIPKVMAPVSMGYIGPYVFFVRNGLPVTSYRDLVAHAKAQRVPLKYGASTTAVDLAFQYMTVTSGAKYDGIPYKGAAQVITAMLGGNEIDVTFTSPAGFTGPLQAGRVRALFIAADKRSPLMPDVPTSTEAGIPNFNYGAYWSLWAPQGTPRDIIQRLNTEIAAAARNPAIIEAGRNLTGEVITMSPEETLRVTEAHIKLMTDMVKMTGFVLPE